MANQRKYTSAKVFKKAIDKYLRSIQTVEDTGFVDLDGKPIRTVVYVVPPSIADIRLAVGMSADTWGVYASGEYDDEDNDFSAVCASAKEECERYLIRQLSTRTKGIDGIKFNLQCNFGWGGSKHEIELGEQSRRTFEASSLTMEEKIARLSALPDMLKLIGGDTDSDLAVCHGEDSESHGGTAENDEDGDVIE